MFMEHGDKRALGAVALVLLVLLLRAIPAQANAFRVARVSEIYYPMRVICRQEFSVTVTFEYASRVLVDVGIVEEESRRVVQSLTLISGFFGPGNVTFVFNLTAPDAPALWRLIATTRAWWADSWFADPSQGEKAFAVEVVSGDRFWLNVTSGYAFQVDGLRHEPRNGREVGILLPRGQHTVFVEPLRPVSQGVRHVFDRWGDGVQSNPRVVNLFHDVRLIALYRTEYLLSVDSEYGDPTGEGWYGQDRTVWFAVSPEARAATFGALVTKNVFDRWEGDWSGDAPIAAIRMSGPKRVHAVWRRELEFALGPLAHWVTSSMILASLFLFIRRAKKRHIGRKLVCGVFSKRRITLVVAVWLTVSSIAITPLSAGGSDTTVRVGGTYWRHWKNLESDTSVIWLGGGIEGPPLIINPYWLESYNTMQFVQDLAKYYSVLTPERGSSAIYQTALNRIIQAEFYPSMLVHDARVWATTAGYRYVYLVGYSVGGIAAAREATITDPEGWSSPNGIVLITVPMDQFVPYARALKANHLILFGAEMTKSYVDSGRSFFESTPARGQYDNRWLNKEFRVINSVAHEVWTIARTGQYDSEATAVTVGFIEQSKTLELEKQKLLLRYASVNQTRSLPTNTQARVELTEVTIPHRVPSGEIFRVSATVRWQKLDNARGWVALYSPDTDTIVSVRQVSSLENGSERVSLIARAPSEDLCLRLNLLVLCDDNDRWTFPTGNFSLSLKILVSETVDLIIKTTVPGIQVRVNGALHISNEMGLVKTAVVRGHSVVEVPSVTYLTNHKRAIFEGWKDGQQSAKRAISIVESCQIEAFFRLQYYVSAFSEVGHIVGEGWYDQNATATIVVSPPIVQDLVNGTLVTYRFDRWFLDTKERSMALTLVVRGPTEVQARWLKVAPEGKEVLTVYVIEVFVSLSVLIISLVFARGRRDLAKDERHARQREQRLWVFQGDSTPGTLGKGTASHIASSPHIHLVNLSTPMPKPADDGTPRLSILKYHR